MQERRRSYDKVLGEISKGIKYLESRTDRIVQELNNQDKRIGSLEGWRTAVTLTVSAILSLVALAVAVISILK